MQLLRREKTRRRFDLVIEDVGAYSYTNTSAQDTSLRQSADEDSC